MSEPAPTEARFPVMDSAASQLILCVGRKESGKSELARQLYADYPHDKIVIDVNRDAEPDPPGEVITTPLPGRFPARGDDGQPRNLHFHADPGSATYREDIDRAVGLALWPSDRRCMVWLDEIGEASPPGRTPPHLRRLLMQSRHYGPASAVMCGPRPMNIDPLCLQQADYVALFTLPNPADRARVAETIGYPPARLDAELEETTRRGKFWFLLWDARDAQLYRCPPLPL